MNRTISGLDVIIRKIGKEETVPAGYKSFLFDEVNLVILSKGPSIFSIGKRTGRYVISDNEVASIDNFSLLLDNGIGINIRYSARCASGYEAKVLTSLFDRERTVETVLNEKLGHYIRNIFQEKVGKITYESLRLIQDEIHEKCLADIGLIITPVIIFQRETNLKRFPIKSEPLSVRVNDYNGSLNLEYEIEVLPLETDLEVALKRSVYLDNLKQRLNEIIYDEIWKKVSLNQFCFALNIGIAGGEEHEKTVSVKEMISNAISVFLAEEGRQMGFLRLCSSSIENIVPSEQVDIEHKGAYKIADDGEVIIVKSNLSLKLMDVSLYKRAEEKYNIKKHSKSFKEWFTEYIVTPLIGTLLFTKKYEEILIETDAMEEKIKREISVKAGEMGFSIKQHMYMPDIRNLVIIKNGFEVNMENSSFTTKSSSFDIKFNIKIKGRITDLKVLKNRGLLSPKASIEGDIKNGVRSVLEYKILDIPPENIYLRNESASSLGEQKKVEEELQSEVIDYLVTSYSVDKASVTVIINFSEKEDMVYKAYERLKKNKISFQVCCTPSSKEVICFKIIYEITGISEGGWERFSNQISKKTEDIISEMAEALENRISSDLNNYTYDEIMESTAIQVQAKTFAPAFNDIGKTFGLCVIINSSKRLQTGMETGILDVNKKRIDALVTDLSDNISVKYDQQRVLLDGYKKLLEEAVKDKEFDMAEQIQVKISKIEEAIKSSVTQSTKSLGYSSEVREKEDQDKADSNDQYVEILPDEDK